MCKIAILRAKSPSFFTKNILQRKKVEIEKCPPQGCESLHRAFPEEDQLVEKACFGNQTKAGFCIWNGKNGSIKVQSGAERLFRPFPGEGFFRFHFQVASFFKFMAANLSFTQFAT